jgi:hypothetical protein
MQLLRHVFARLALPALVGFMAFRPALGQPATVILVRHAERAQTPAGDPVLTDAGLARAADLAATLANASVTSVITTHLQRTQLTARHVMQANGQTHIVVRAGGPIQTHVDSVARFHQLLLRWGGQRCLISVRISTRRCSSSSSRPAPQTVNPQHLLA